MSGVRSAKLHPLPPAITAKDAAAPLAKIAIVAAKWRAWKRWQFENHCGDAHELVCDLCHIDAHIQAHLPVTKPLDELIDTYSLEDEMLSHDYPELNGELANRLAGLFKELA